MKHLFNLLLLISLSCTVLTAQGSFTAKLDAQEIFEDSYVTATFTVRNGELKNFKAPTFKNFTVVQGPSTSSRTSITNGKVRSENSVSYVLKPNKTGKLNIAAATVNLNGKKARTKPLSVSVIKSSKKKSSQQKYFIEAVLSDSIVYLGEQVIVDYIFYYLPGANINSVRIQNEDDFDGFYATAINDYQNNKGKKIINGTEYIYQIVRKVALFPQNAGKFTLDPTTFVVFIPKSKRTSIFFNSFDQDYVIAPAQNLTIQPIPSSDPFFSGAVGNYAVAGKSNKQSITTDQSISLILTLFGDGDPKLLIPPTLSLTDSLEVYDPNFLREENYIDKGKQKHKTSYEYLVVPKYPGKYSIKPSITYFSTDSNKYVRTYTSTIKLNVVQGKGIAQNQDATLSERADKMASFIPQMSLSKKGWKFYNSFPFWLLLGLSIAAYPALGYLKYKKIQEDNIDPEWLKSQNASKIAEAKLAIAKKHQAAGDQRSFYEEISNSILGYASDKIKIPVSELSKQNIVEKLAALDIASEETSSITEILSSCEMALFAGSNESSKMQKTYDSALQTLSNIEKQLT